jgi:hypothetical protein
MPTQQEISLNPTSSNGQILSFDGSARIGISPGTNGQVLVSSSTATSGAIWTTFSTSANFGFAVIASDSFTAATHVISNIPQDYQHLMFVLRPSSSRYFDNFYATFTGSSHKTMRWDPTGNTTVSYEQTGAQQSYLMMHPQGYYDTNAFFGRQGSSIMYIFNYSDSDKCNPGFANSMNYRGGDSTNEWGYELHGWSDTSASALTSVTFTGNTFNGQMSGSWTLFGIRRYGE